MRRFEVFEKVPLSAPDTYKKGSLIASYEDKEFQIAVFTKEESSPHFLMKACDKKGNLLQEEEISLQYLTKSQIQRLMLEFLEETEKEKGEEKC